MLRLPQILVIIVNLAALCINVPLLMFDAGDPHSVFRGFLVGANMMIVFYEVFQIWPVRQVNT